MAPRLMNPTFLGCLPITKPRSRLQLPDDRCVAGDALRVKLEGQGQTVLIEPTRHRECWSIHTGGQVTHDWRVPPMGVDVIQLDINPFTKGNDYEC